MPILVSAVIAVMTQILFVVASPARAAAPARPGDFDGDGRVDVVANAPGLTVNGQYRAGGLAVLSGGRLPGMLITQDTEGIPEDATIYEGFGADFASGDFNADGFADLAIGDPGDGIDIDGDGTDDPGVGSVTIVYGSLSGLTGRGSQLVSQASPGVPGDPWFSERFGGSLATGDFNGDRLADLAIGSVNDQDGRQWSGSITVLFGTSAGLSSADAQLVTNTDGAYEFGVRLAAADVTGDGKADLTQLAHMGILGMEAQVIGYPGHSGGLDTTNAFHSTVPDFSTDFAATAVGDLTGDGKADVVVGDPQYASEAGGRIAVLVSQGNTLDNPQIIDQETVGVPDASQPDDRFGWSLAIGDTDRDGKADLAIGAPGEDVDGSDTIAGGAVTVLRGSTTGVISTGAKQFTQDTAGVPDSGEVADLFGNAVSLHDHTGDGRADLVVGAPQEVIDAFINSGQITVFNGVNPRRTTTVNLLQLGVTNPDFTEMGSALLP